MPGLFDPKSEDMVLNALRKSRQNDRGQLKMNFDMAIDYLNNDQARHVEEALYDRYEQAQMGDKGQEIVPVTMPLTERYIAEAASAYNKPVERAVVNAETNEEDEQWTEPLEEYLKRIGYDEKMHRNEQLSILLATSSIWYQEKRGVLRPVITYPQDIYPIVNPNDPHTDPADATDYLGFVVEVMWTDDDATSTTKKTYAAILRDRTFFFEARDPYSPPDRVFGITRNPFTWPQPDENGNTEERPLQMLTFWHKQQYENELIVKTDPDIAYSNHELNIQWSLLFDTMRLQGWSTAVMNLINPDKAGAKQKHGARFPVVMDIGESFALHSAPAPYAAIVDALQTFTKLFAIAKRQSPNDFSVEQAAAMSGFAKIVDSLPKIEARNERLRRLKRLEEQVAWPRIASVLRKEKIFPADIATKYKLSVKFASVEIPKSPDEIRTELETNFKHNLSNPIEVLTERHGISREEAENIHAENKELNSNGGQQPNAFGAPGQRPETNALAKLVANRKSIKVDKEKEEDEKPPAR